MMESYLNTYVDRRMKLLVDEWQLANRADIQDFSRRIEALSNDIARMDTVGKEAALRLDYLEARAKRLEALLK